MLGFTIKRLAFTLISIPIILWFMLFLTGLSPVDPVEQLIDANDFSADKLEQARIYEATAKKMGYNKAPFYFTLTKSNYSKDFYSLAHPLKKDFYTHFLNENYGYEELHSFYKQLNLLRDSSENLRNFDEFSNPAALIRLVRSEIIDHSESTKFSKLSVSLDQLINSKNVSHSLKPRILFFGKNNLFHEKLSNLVSLNWGNSLKDGKSAKSKIFNALRITLLMLFMALILGYAIGISLGIWFHRNSTSVITRILESLFYVLNSIPLFVFALLLLLIFTTAEISPHLRIFPAVNAYGWSSMDTFTENLSRNFSQLILPVVCISIYSVAYISRQVRESLDREDIQLYNITGKMKGATNWQLFSHRFKNIRGILITMIGGGIVSGFSGALLIEYIFNIPGIGRLLIDSVKSNDLKVMLPIVIILFVVSSVVLLISDLLYRFYNPKIDFTDE